MEHNTMHAAIEMDKVLPELGEAKLYMSSLSRPQMESLSAVCDAFLPSIDLSGAKISDESLVAFFGTSASMAGTPLHVGGMISERLKHPWLWLNKLTLWLLSTWYGTLVLCGKASLTIQFPYVQRFSDLPLEKREQILLSWSTSYFSLIRMLFIAMKFLTMLAFFTQVDQNNNNPSWKAMDYCGPDPDLKHKPKHQQKPNNHNNNVTMNSSKEELIGPLYEGVISPKQAQKNVVEALRNSGFPVSLCSQKCTNVKSKFLQPSLVIKCDAVVVGSGSGGGVVAGVLAKNGYKVLVIEKGKYLARTNLSLLEGQAMDQMYLGSGLLASKDMGVVILAGSTVGGGSTINWSASIRTPQHVRKEWSECYELELFESDLYNEALDVVCKCMGVQSEFEDEGFHNMVLRKGCEELGYPVNNIPRNATPDHYCGWCCFGCKYGRKKGTSETWLKDLVDSGNGVILAECEAIEVLRTRKPGRNRSIAAGVAVEFEVNGVKEIYVIESKVTVVSCGALCTPSLLRRSGLKNPNIGKNLHLHPVAMAWGYFPDGHPAKETWPEAKKKSYQGGIMTAMSTVVGNFTESGYGAVIQTPALHPGMFSALVPWLSGMDFKKRMCKFSRTAHLFALARDKGSADIGSHTSVNYRMAKIDEDNLQRGLENVLRILAAAGAEEIGTHHNKGNVLNVKQSSFREFDRFVKEESSRALRDLSTPICSAHQMGSCRMGVDPKSSAVNPMGETWEVEGLYVADSSVFPTALGVNPMVTVQAIAYCTAQSILQSLRRRKDITQLNIMQ